jgi:GNAT superfamily N-acetyltransferase
MDIQFRQAESGDVDVVSAVLTEAAAWLEARGMGLWRASELTPAEILEDVSQGLFFLAEHDSQTVGTIKFQLSDVLFWPDVPRDDAAFIHRVAVRREFAGGTVSSALLSWAAQRTGSLGRPFLRLDCDAARPRLRAVYERFGFRHHSDRQVGPYLVARYQLDVRALKTDSTEPAAV